MRFVSLILAVAVAAERQATSNVRGRGAAATAQPTAPQAHRDRASTLYFGGCSSIHVSIHPPVHPPIRYSRQDKKSPGAPAIPLPSFVPVASRATQQRLAACVRRRPPPQGVADPGGRAGGSGMIDGGEAAHRSAALWVHKSEMFLLH
uniref:Secreted protein n=1 Tax=Setaria italica TaxID=4555 RepID=K4AGA9_SETIT